MLGVEILLALLALTRAYVLIKVAFQDLSIAHQRTNIRHVSRCLAIVSLNHCIIVSLCLIFHFPSHLHSLIDATSIAYAQSPSYTRYAPGQEPFTALLSSVVRELPEILAQDELDRVAGGGQNGESKHVQVMWGAMDGGEGVRSGESWAQA